MNKQPNQHAEAQPVTSALDATPDGIWLRIKVVPGSSRDRIAGMLGDRVKVSVAAPPEGGKANKAVCQLLARVLGVPKRGVAVTDGQTRPQKTISIVGISAADATARLQLEVDA